MDLVTASNSEKALLDNLVDEVADTFDDPMSFHARAPIRESERMQDAEHVKRVVYELVNLCDRRAALDVLQMRIEQREVK